MEKGKYKMGDVVYGIASGDIPDLRPGTVKDTDFAVDPPTYAIASVYGDFVTIDVEWTYIELLPRYEKVLRLAHTELLKKVRKVEELIDEVDDY